MKKILSFMLSAIMVLSFAACSADAPEKEFSMALSSYDEDSRTATNRAAGLECVVPRGYTFVGKDAFSATYYDGKTEREIMALTHRQLMEYVTLPDYIISSPDHNISVRVNYVNTTKGYGQENLVVDVLIDELLAMGKSENACVLNDVNLGGYDYKVVGQRGIEADTYNAVRKISDDFAVTITFTAKDRARAEYCWDMFNGGQNIITAENLPARSDFDVENGWYTNKTTGTQFSVPFDWFYYIDGDMAEEFFGITEERLKNMTGEEMAALPKIYDFYAVDASEENDILTYFVNVTTPRPLYGTTVDEYMQRYINSTLDKGWIETEDIKTVDLSGEEFLLKSFFISKDEIRMDKYVMMKAVDENYIYVIECCSKISKTADDFIYYFNNQTYTGDESAAQLKMSEYYQAKHSFYNEYTDITYKLPDGWQLRDAEYIAENNYDGVTADEMLAWTAEDYAQYQTIADFERYSTETGDSFAVYYENMNFYEYGIGNKMDVYNYADGVVEEQLKDENYTLNESFTLEMDGRKMVCLDFAYDDGEMAMNICVTMCRINDDYITYAILCSSTMTMDDMLNIVWNGKMV